MTQENPIHLTIETLQYVRKFYGETILIKLGGAAIREEEIIQSLCSDLALIRSVGISVVIVHGGGPAINEQLSLHGIEWSFFEGQRVTSHEMMDVVEMVLCGKVNRQIVRTLNKYGVKAIGLSGPDASSIVCSQASPELGQVGKIDRIDTDLINHLLEFQNSHKIGFVPVISPIGFNKDGEAFNINADWAASRIAQALKINKIFYLTDQDGILNSDGSIFSELDAASLEQLIEQKIVTGGMLAKARTIIDALKNGINDIHLINGKRPHGLIQELFTQVGVGTICRSRSTFRS